MKIGIVGVGGISRRHIEGLRAFDEVEIVATVDAIPERARQIAESCGAAAYESLDDALPHVDAVYVLTPPSFHRQFVVQALEAGKHLMVEKPISMSLDDAEAMVAAAEASGTKPMTAFNMRFR